MNRYCDSADNGNNVDVVDKEFAPMIPEKYNPTEKQEKTILFINNHLGMDIQPLTKHQCWLDIGKYFERAKRTSLHDDQYYIDMQEYCGMDESDFC